jgi:hypothetical protein
MSQFLPFTREIKSRRMKFIVYVAHIEEIRIEYKYLIRNPEESIPYLPLI